MSYSSTRTSTASHTRTHTATHLAGVILGSIVDILGTLGIDATQLYADWDKDEKAITAWILEGSLKAVALECHRPDGEVKPVIEFPVSYETPGNVDAAFTADRASLAVYLAKLKSVPSATTYKLFCTFNGDHSTQPGWGPGTRSSTTGMRSSSFGTLASGPHASASLQLYE